MAEMKNSDQQMFLCWSEALMPSFAFIDYSKKTAQRSTTAYENTRFVLLNILVDVHQACVFQREVACKAVCKGICRVH